MKNFPVIVDGKEYWISRSVAVAVTVFSFIGKEFCVLANKRGKGLPNHVGEWNVVSGYIDYDETLEQACVREVFEETGVNLKGKELHRMDIEDEPSRENQVILFRYVCFIWDKGNDFSPTNKYSEPDEVDDVKWIPLKEVDNYTWTSEKHKERIKEYADFVLRCNSTANALNKYYRDKL